jgi:AcrR family transcriptional regulator
MPGTRTTTSQGGRRPRHDPRESEREILDAAEQFLRERPWREVTVQAIMERTDLARPAFYVHFKDRHDLALRVVDRIRAELLVEANRWFEGEGASGELRAALEGVTAVYVEHGPVLKALSDASGSDATVEAAYHELIQGFVDATDRHIREEQAAGRSPGLDAQETARALVWMVEAYLLEALGAPSDVEPARVVDALVRIWSATLYGAA